MNRIYLVVLAEKVDLALAIDWWKVARLGSRLGRKVVCVRLSEVPENNIQELPYFFTGTSLTSACFGYFSK